jgi:hypothetical protein
MSRIMHRACVSLEGRAQEAWRAYLDHATACDACREVEAGCEKGKELRHAWRSSRGEAGR